MYALFLNPMTSNMETRTCVAIANERTVLEQLLDSETVPTYTDEGPDTFSFTGGTKNYHKCFKKGGILEMYNSPADSFCEPHGIIEIDSQEDIIKYFDVAKADAITAWYSNFGSAALL